MKLMDAIALRIQELLIYNKMTQYQLYKKSGVPQSTISTIMNKGDKTCKLDTIAQLCQGFGIGLNDFFCSHLFTFEAIEIE